MTRAAVLGTGWIARRVHIPFLVAHPTVMELVVSDVDAKRASQVAAEFGLRAVPVAEAIEGADIVVLCTPPHTHAELALRAMAAGKNVVVEKPLATTAADAWRVVTAARESGSNLHTCYTNRFRRDVVALSELVHAGEIGDVVEVSARWLRRDGVPGTEGARETGVLWDLGSHLADLVLGLVPRHATGTVIGRDGPAELVEFGNSWYGDANPAVQMAEVRPDFSCTAFFDGGPVATLRVSWCSDVVMDRVEIDVVGTAGVANLRTVFGFSPDRQRISGPSLRVTDAETGRTRNVIHSQSREPVEYRDQLTTALTHSADLSDVDRAAAAVALCEAATRSAEAAAPVRFALTEMEIACAR